MILQKIINMGIVAHVDAGKTTLTEQLLYHAGSSRKMGKVDEGTAHTDWLDIERKRGISVRASSVRLSFEGKTINIIDTPGHVDFAGEVERSLQILDFAVLVISAVEGIQSQTEVLLEALRSTKTNTLVFINKIDRAGSDLASIVDRLKTEYGEPVLFCSEVEREGEKDASVRPRELFGQEEKENTLLALAENEESLLEHYLSGNDVSCDTLKSVMMRQINGRKLIPVLAGSGMTGAGMDDLLAFLINCFEGVKSSSTAPLSGVVYQITHDKTLGKISHVRLFSGNLKPRDSIMLPKREGEEEGGFGKITQIKQFFGAKASDLGELTAGDIGGLCGIPALRIGDWIGDRQANSAYQMAVPLLKVQAVPEEAGDLFKLKEALSELSEEDPLLDMEFIAQTREIHIKITGTIQLEILKALLSERYGMKAEFSSPTVIYKETPKKEAVGFESYTMPKPCWAVVKLLIQPLPRGSGFSFESVVPNNDIFYRYQNHIETAVKETLKQGMYNWEVCDLKVTLIGGNHHTVHTHPLDFFLATPIAVMDGLRNAGTTLLEPVVEMKLSAGEEYLGKIIGDLIAMRGEFDSPVIQKGQFTLKARVPVSTSLHYSVDLAVLTSGTGFLSARFCGYQECPLELGAVNQRNGTNPLDRAKWILEHRSAMS